MKTKIKPIGILFMIAFSTFCTARCMAQGQAQSTPARDSNDNPKLDIEIVDDSTRATARIRAFARITPRASSSKEPLRRRAKPQN